MISRQEIEMRADQALEKVLEGRPAGQVENELVDFKEFMPPKNNDRDPFKAGCQDLAEAIACLANSRGGCIIVGVHDKFSGSRALVGLPDTLTADVVRRRIWELTDPPLAITVEEIVRQQVRLLKLVVEPTYDLHKVGGKWRERVGTGCEPMTPSRVAQVLDERRQVDWSGQATAWSMSEVSEQAVEEARLRLREAGDQASRRRAELSKEDLLRELGVVDGQGRLLRAGALLFCTTAVTEDARIQYLRKDTPSGPLTRPPRFFGQPLLVALRELLLVVEASTPSLSVTLQTGVQQQLQTLPLEVVREALVNALAHRDYRVPEPIVIEHSANTLVVSSPGGFMEGITVDNILTHPSKPRNRTLAHALSVLHLAERAGTGVDLMVRAMVRTGLEPPLFDASAEFVRVVLNGGTPVTQVARLLSNVPQRVRDDTDTILAIHYLLTHATVTAQQLALVVQKTPEETARVLRELSDPELELLEPTLESSTHRWPTYRFRDIPRSLLGTVLTYHHTSSTEVERRIQAHLREYGSISNETVRNLCQVSQLRASQILRALVDRQVIVRTPDSPTRGRGVRYSAGPALTNK